MQISNYVLLTAAHNEEVFIEATIRSILEQETKPRAWVIVNDASTDRTAEIVRKYCSAHSFIQLVERDGNHRHDFAQKSYALAAGYEVLKQTPSDFIGILDADITYDPDYYAQVLREFELDPDLGVAGGVIYERKNGVFVNRASNRIWSIAGAVQMFRRECYEKAGGILPLRYGGEDWCAQASVEAMGWKARANPALRAYHHRTTGAASSGLRSSFRQGRMEYSFGTLLIFEVLKCLYRFFEHPVGIGAAARFAGFVSSYFTRIEDAVPDAVSNYLRREQARRVRALFGLKRAMAAGSRAANLPSR